MSLNNSRITSFLNTSKDIPNSLHSDLNTSKLCNIENTRRTDLYRSDYILPLKRTFTSYVENNPQNFLGHKLNRNNDSNKGNKVLIPNDKRYHRTLLQTSLEKIRNEIKQKRIENANRMNELNEKAINLNENYRNKNRNNINQYIGDFKIKIENCYKNNINNNTISLKETETNKSNRIFDKDMIYFDLNESFSINNNKIKKIEPQNIFIPQRQNEFSYKHNNKNNNSSNIITKNDNNDNNKVLFGAPKNTISTTPLSNNFTFGVNPIKKNNNKESLFDNNKEKKIEKTSLFDTKTENKKENLEKNDKKENKNKENKENKILFGAPKEYTKTTPLSNNFSFGLKPKIEEKKIEVENKKEEQKVKFGCPTTEVISQPLSSNVTFGFVAKKEEPKKEEIKKEEPKTEKSAVIFGAPKDNNLPAYQPLSDKVTFGFKKEENKENKPLFKGDLFPNTKNENKQISLFDSNKKNEEEKNKPKSLFSSTPTTNLFQTTENKDTLFNLSNKKKKIEDSNNNKSLFEGEKKVGNLFTNTDKETKVVSINAINTSGSLFGNDEKKKNKKSIRK